MKSLLKFLSPFAPDQSGAVSAIYELGGLLVICDAGGCTGNICGFDEPRWFQKKSAVFSAGLRDMDAILGRDDKLIEKLKDAAEHLKPSFTAIIGTPVPAVIATDLKALKRMAEKRTGLPALTIEATGTGYYDVGEERAMLELFRTFATKKLPVESDTAGVLGVTPLEYSSLKADQEIRKALLPSGYEHIICYGMGSGLEEVKKASQVKMNYVVAPAAIKTAQYLKNTFGTPYQIRCPYIPEHVRQSLMEVEYKNILIIHQQILANGVRDELHLKCNAKVTVASWFMMKEELMEEGDFRIRDEEQFVSLVKEGDYDCIIADNYLIRALRGFDGKVIDFPHFAVSGRMEGGEGSN